MSLIYWDTNVFIYLLNNEKPMSTRILKMLAAIDGRGDDLVTSAMTLGEVLSGKSTESERAEWRSEIERCARILPFDRNAGLIFSDVRRATRLKPPDAIHLATAASAGVDLFVTSDLDLIKKAPFVPGIRFITTLDRAPI